MSRFYGKFNKINLRKLDKCKISFLLKNEIISKCLYDLDLDLDFDSVAVTFQFEGKTYKLSEELLDDIYNDLKETIETNDINVKKTAILYYGMGAYLDNEGKIAYLKEEYSKLFPKESLPFSLYIGEDENFSWKEVDDGFTWKENIIHGIGIPAIELYLSKNYLEFLVKDYDSETQEWISGLERCYHYRYHLDKMFEFDRSLSDMFELIKSWQSFYETKQMLGVIKSKIQELESNKSDDKYNKILKDLFLKEEDYDRIILRLKSEEIITDDYVIIIEDSDELRLMSAIGYLLKKSGYLNYKVKDYVLANAISNEFKHIKKELKPNTFSNHQKYFDNYYPLNIKSEKHLDRLHFIIK